MRVLCLDVGARRIGVAMSDPEGLLATPLTVVEHRDYEGVADRIGELIQEHGVQLLLVGMPRSLDGSLGHQAAEVDQFIGRLSEQISIPIETWDERLSTVAAQRMMMESGAKRSARKDSVDAMAATLILQGYLDRAQFE